MNKEELKKEISKLNRELNEENIRCMVLANNETFMGQVIDEMAKFIDTELSSEHLSRVLKKEVKPLKTYSNDIKKYFYNKVRLNK